MEVLLVLQNLLFEYVDVLPALVASVFRRLGQFLEVFLVENHALLVDRHALLLLLLSIAMQLVTQLLVLR